jgi:5-formyltetrahydrofolate cyclo-ligase
VSRPSPLEPRFMGTKLRRLSGGPFPTCLTMNNSAPEIRKEVRQYLNQLAQIEREQLTRAAIDHFLATPEYRRCKYLAAFYPVRHELDLMPLIEQCWGDGKKVFLPRLLPRPFQKMRFLPYTANTPMRLNRYKIPEPALSSRHEIPIRQLDIVITPLLAFGLEGQRLGMGGGYYDRTFAFLNRSSYQKPRLWAIALEAQRFAMQANPWDVAIHGVATQQDIYRYD